MVADKLNDFCNGCVYVCKVGRETEYSVLRDRIKSNHGELCLNVKTGKT